MLIAPATALLPNKVLCGPFRISIRLTSVKPCSAITCIPIGTSSITTTTSASTPTPTEVVPMPRMLMLLFEGTEP